MTARSTKPSFGLPGTAKLYVLRRSKSLYGTPRRQLQVHLTTADFEAAQKDFVPLSLRDVKLQKSEVQWADIGGQSSRPSQQPDADAVV